MNKRVWAFFIWNRQFILYYLRVYFKSLTKSYFWKFLTYADSKKLLIFLNCKFQDIIAKLVQDKKSIVLYYIVLYCCLLLPFLHVSLLIWTKYFYQRIPPWTLKVIWPLLTLFYPGSWKTLLPGGGIMPPPPIFLALVPPKAQKRTLAHLTH